MRSVEVCMYLCTHMYRRHMPHWTVQFVQNPSPYSKIHFQYSHLSPSGCKTRSNVSSSPSNCITTMSPVLVETIARVLSEVNTILWAEPTSRKTGTFCRLGFLPCLERNRNEYDKQIRLCSEAEQSQYGNIFRELNKGSAGYKRQCKQNGIFQNGSCGPQGDHQAFSRGHQNMGW
jgi:hypothetical protein